MTDPHPNARPTRIAGTTLLVLGALHTVATLGAVGGTLLTMIQAGWWRTADPSAGVEWLHVAVFWSLFFGAMLALMGWSLRCTAAGASPVGRPWAITFGVMCLVGALAVPAGGFWFGAILGGWLAVRG